MLRRRVESVCSRAPLPVPLPPGEGTKHNNGTEVLYIFLSSLGAGKERERGIDPEEACAFLPYLQNSYAF